MKFFFLFVLVICLSPVFSQNNPNQDSKTWMDSFYVNMQKVVGKKIDTFHVISNTDKIYTNDSLEGKVTLVNFWFEACAPCVAEFDALNKLYKKFEGNTNFRILAFTNEKPEEIKRIKEKYKLLFELISISNKDCYRLNFGYGFPTNILIGKNARVNYINVGGSLKSSEVAAYFTGTLIPKINDSLYE